eukprot:SAG31_NODE_25103_length_468_cov_0.650407_1_plen_57_part_00
MRFCALGTPGRPDGILPIARHLRRAPSAAPLAPRSRAATRNVYYNFPPPPPSKVVR